MGGSHQDRFDHERPHSASHFLPDFLSATFLTGASHLARDDALPVGFGGAIHPADPSISFPSPLHSVETSHPFHSANTAGSCMASSNTLVPTFIVASAPVAM
jgi:hypothetical protein